MIPSAQICGAFSANTPGGAFQPRLPGTKSPEDVHNTMSGPGHFFPGTGFSEKDYNDLMVFSQPGLCFFSELFSDYRVNTCGHDLAFTDIYDQSHKLFRASRALTVLHTLLRALALPQCSLQHCNIIQVIII